LVGRLRADWATPWPENTVLFDGSSAAGGATVAAYRTPASSGVGLLDPATGRLERSLETYSSESQALGAYDGSYAVWEESHASGMFSDYVVKEWDARTGAISTVGHAHTDSHGRAIEGTDELPVIAGGHAAWIEAVKDDGDSDLVVLDLATGRRTVIRRAHITWTALTPRSIVWAESLRPGAKTVIRAADVATGRSVAPPAALADARGAWNIVSDGTGWAWIDGNRPTLYAAPTGSSKALDIGVVPQGGASPTIAISHGIVTVPVSAGGMMVVDVRTRAWTYEPRASFPVLDGDTFLVPELSSDKSATQGTAVARMSLSDLGTLRCAS
jgi:hypothetical protein